MKNKFIFLLLGILLISFASASIDYVEENETYIIDSFLPTWLFGDGESTVELIDNTDYCLIDCEAILKFTNEEPVILTEDIAFIDKQGRNTINNIRDLEFLIGKYKDVEKTRPIYSQVCEDKIINSTLENICYQTKTGEETYLVNELIWEDYEGTEESREAYLKIKGKKNPLSNIDWIITFRGEELKAWAWWSSSWGFKRELSNLTGDLSALQFIDFDSDMKTDFSDLRFIDSATESIELNYTIEKKVNSDWALVRINNLGDTSVYMYYGNSLATDNSNSENVYHKPTLGYFLDEDSLDFVGSNNGIVVGAINSTGYINDSFDFDGTNDYIDIGDLDFLYNGVYSFSVWVRVDGESLSGSSGNIYAEGKAGVSDTIKQIGVRDTDRKLTLFFRSSGTHLSAESSTALNLNTWHNIILTDNNGNYNLYIDNVNVDSGSYSQAGGDFTNSHIGGLLTTANQNNFNGKIDEFYKFNKVLSSEERSSLFNQTQPNFITGSEEENQGVSTQLISPGTGTNFTNPYINFTFSSIPNGVNLTNATLYLWNETSGSLVLTNFTTLNGSQTVNTSFLNNLSQGNYKWNAETCAENVGCEFALINNSFVVHTGTPDILISNPTGAIDYFLLGNNETLNYSISEAGVNVSTHFTECWYIYPQTENSKPNGTLTLGEDYNLSDGTVSSGTTNENLITYDLIFPSGQRIINTASSNNTLRISNFQTGVPDCLNESFSTNTNVGSINQFACTKNEDNKYFLVKLLEVNSNNITLESYDINHNLDCSENTTSFEYILGQNSLCVHATDEFGLHSQNTTTWEYKLLEVNQTYNEEVTEGSLETFLANLRLGSGLSISEAVLFSYNGSMSTGQSFINGVETILRNANFLIPNVETDKNITFYWSVTLSDSTALNLSSQNQTIYNLAIDNCSSYTTELFNFTVVDEETQDILPNATIETAVNIYDETRTAIIINYSNIFQGINPLRICINRNISNNTMYSVDVIARYEDSGSANEYYNIVNNTLTNNTESQIITLYDLNLTDSTDFQLSFTGSDFLPVENALVYVDRQYISENTFKTVELPKTDYNGQTVLHLVRNDVIYNIRIIKDGIVLGNFENLVAFCDDFTIGDCNIELNAFDSVESIFSYNDALGIIYTSPIYNKNESKISFNFVTSDGSAKTVRLEVSRNDIFGNRSICNSSLLSSGGTLECSINPNIDESVLKISVYTDEVITVTGNVQLDTTNYGVAGYLIMFIMAMSFIFMFSGSKTGVLISLAITLAGALGMGIVSGSLIGVGASGIWLLLIIFIGIYKLNKDETP